MLGKKSTPVGRASEKEKEISQAADSERRSVFKRVGKYAAYTAPAMLALLLSRDTSGY